MKQTGQILISIVQYTTTLLAVIIITLYLSVSTINIWYKSILRLISYISHLNIRIDNIGGFWNWYMLKPVINMSNIYITTNNGSSYYITNVNLVFNVWQFIFKRYVKLYDIYIHHSYFKIYIPIGSKSLNKINSSIKSLFLKYLNNFKADDVTIRCIGSINNKSTTLTISKMVVSHVKNDFNFKINSILFLPSIYKDGYKKYNENFLKKKIKKTTINNFGIGLTAWLDIKKRDINNEITLKKCFLYWQNRNKKLYLLHIKNQKFSLKKTKIGYVLNFNIYCMKTCLTKLNDSTTVNVDLNNFYSWLKKTGYLQTLVSQLNKKLEKIDNMKLSDIFKSKLIVLNIIINLGQYTYNLLCDTSSLCRNLDQLENTFQMFFKLYLRKLVILKVNLYGQIFQDKVISTISKINNKKNVNNRFLLNYFKEKYPNKIVVFIYIKNYEIFNILWKNNYSQDISTSRFLDINKKIKINILVTDIDYWLKKIINTTNNNSYILLQYIKIILSSLLQSPLDSINLNFRLIKLKNQQWHKLDVSITKYKNRFNFKLNGPEILGALITDFKSIYIFNLRYLSYNLNAKIYEYISNWLEYKDLDKSRTILIKFNCRNLQLNNEKIGCVDISIFYKNKNNFLNVKYKSVKFGGFNLLLEGNLIKSYQDKLILLEFKVISNNLDNAVQLPGLVLLSICHLKRYLYLLSKQNSSFNKIKINLIFNKAINLNVRSCMRIMQNLSKNNRISHDFKLNIKFRPNEIFSLNSIYCLVTVNKNTIHIKNFIINGLEANIFIKGKINLSYFKFDLAISIIPKFLTIKILTHLGFITDIVKFNINKFIQFLWSIIFVSHYHISGYFK